MKFGIHSGLWMTRWTDEIDPIMSVVADLGFDGIEISLLGITLERAASLNAAARDRGLEITCSTGLGAHEDPTSADPEMRSAAQAAMENAIRITAALGARQLAGVIAAPWGVFDPGDKAGRAERSAALLGGLDPLLSQEGVVLGVEVINRFETDLINTAQEGIAYCDAVGSPHIGLLLDTFHLNIEDKDPPASIRATGNRLAHFHVSDNDRGTPGNGHFDFASTATTLSDIGYDGWVTAEMFVVPGHPTSADLNIWRALEPDPTEAARQALAFMKATFQ
ncbi:sugar phosphate isomerase/epimerase family protein [Hoeflea poritis]|uniref:Sugar phosphate isomerase/epimerase n=1 Tax=Hoeflea poritis TaxID=2993659 RepID=A0ABT4VM35_9HYPH|nr:sugar phosphate isomerase/epimerase family protein [Hoeflea poritis]MDA4845772.1 sugar phosphate isomerase/epimerase [Hoeflea poritis]